MNILRALAIAVLVSAVFVMSAFARDLKSAKKSTIAAQQVVENVDIQGNRRLRDEDLLYYIKTRPGDVYDPAALERDLKELLSLNFFDKTATRVLTEDGIRGGVNVIFEVRELPIIRDLVFKGARLYKNPTFLKNFAKSASASRKNRFTIP
jgi:outer membrane protein assembly factor BamA